MNDQASQQNAMANSPASSPAELTKEQLIAQLKSLTETQSKMIDVINGLQRKAEDPFLQFRTPDPIKNLPPFSGNKKETYAWVEDAETTLQLFEPYRNTPMYTQIVRAIKGKIIGEAKEILIAAGNPSDWDSIKNTLLNSYGDRRDLPSHILSLFYARQGKRSLTEYYNKIKSIDTSIKTTVGSLEDYKLALTEVNKLISLMTLTRFVDGLGEQLSMFVRSHRPDSLEEAYNITLQYSNAAYRQKLDKQPSGQMPSSSKWNPNNVTPPAKQGTFNHDPRNNAKNQSGKFKHRPVMDEDASMRTHISKMQVNNHSHRANELKEESDEEEEIQNEVVENSRMDSEDDDFFVGDEINFHLARKESQRK